MIALTRQRSETVIPANFRGVQRRQWVLELLKKQRALLLAKKGKHNFLSGRWKVVKDQLWLEAVNKCAYCEATTKLVAHGDVEHYRPKKLYWWLAYCYDNYLVSCQLCNQVFKRDAFPTAGPRLTAPTVTATTPDDQLEVLAQRCAPDPINDADGMSLADFTQQHHHERPYLLNPYLDDPELYYAWSVEAVLKRVLLVPVNEAAIPFVEQAEKLYGLNRKELAELRFFFFDLYDTLRFTLEDDGINAPTRSRVEASIETMKAPQAPFAGMIRYFDRQAQGVVSQVSFVKTESRFVPIQQSHLGFDE